MNMGLWNNKDPKVVVGNNYYIMKLEWRWNTCTYTKTSIQNSISVMNGYINQEIIAEGILYRFNEY